MGDPPFKFFERCPRCLKTWDQFPVFRCPSCRTIFCGCCDEDDLPESEAYWLVAIWSELKTANCPACTLPIKDADRIGRIRKHATKGSG